MSLNIKINVDDLARQCKEFAEEAKRDLKKSVAGLAAMTHANVVEMAQKELHSSREKFLNSLSFEEIAKNVWVITVGEEGMFVEEGIESGSDMATDRWLLKNAKTDSKGQKYKVIPFEWSKSRGQLTNKTKELVENLRGELKAQKIPFKGIEKNSKGSPRTGLLHDINFGGQVPGKGNTPVFDRVHIYQKQVKDQKTGKMSTQRDIVTFRTVKAGQGKWVHPGLQAKKYLDVAMEWALREWEEKILPEIFDKYK